MKARSERDIISVGKSQWIMILPFRRETRNGCPQEWAERATSRLSMSVFVSTAYVVHLFFRGDFLEEKPKVTEKKIGNTTYIVSSYGLEIPQAVIKNKLIKIIEQSAARQERKTQKNG